MVVPGSYYRQGRLKSDLFCQAQKTRKPPQKNSEKPSSKRAQKPHKKPQNNPRRRSAREKNGEWRTASGEGLQSHAPIVVGR